MALGYGYIQYNVGIKSIIRASRIRLLEALLGSLPVDNIPDGVEVLGLLVLVLEVVGVLPSVNTEDRSELTNNGILVCVGSDLNGTSLGVLDQPSPAGALDTGQSGVELLLHAIEAAVVGVDGLGEGA